MFEGKCQFSMWITLSKICVKRLRVRTRAWAAGSVTAFRQTQSRERLNANRRTTGGAQDAQENIITLPREVALPNPEALAVVA